MENNCTLSSRPTVMVTNDDGIDAPGLRALLSVLVSSNRFNVLVCAPDSEKSAVSHSVTWRNALSARPVDISGAVAFAISGTPAGLHIFRTFQDSVPLNTRSVSGINMGSNCGYHIGASVVSMISEPESMNAKHENLLFKREVIGSQVEDGDTDYCSLQEGYITVSPLAALSPADLDSQEYFKKWLPGVAECFSSTL